MTSWLSGIIGQGIAANLGNAGGHQAQNIYGVSGCQSSAQAQAIAQQQAYGANMAAGHSQQWRPPKWMFNGKTMEFTEFVNTMFPEDTPEKTAFILKYSEQ